MTYAVSDIHGCYKEFLALLKKIHFSELDTMYVLGDVVDRGPEPIKLIYDLMLRPNVFLITGNHEVMALEVLKRLLKEVTEETVKGWEEDSSELKETMKIVSLWLEDGGSVTFSQLKDLPNDRRGDVLEYIAESLPYEIVEINGKKFVLAHADLHGFEGDFEKLSLADFCMYRADFSRRYFEDENVFLITGHTPTVLIREDKQPLVFEKNGHIAIDCGCVFGGRLAAYCLDDGEVFYVDKMP